LLKQTLVLAVLWCLAIALTMAMVLGLGEGRFQ